MIVAWVLFPLVLALIGLGWGALIERASGTRLSGALLVPLGLAGALVVAGTFTAFASTARAGTPVVAVGAVAGLLVWWPARRFSPWPALAAVGVVLAYGAPVLLTGHATFTGFVKLDDTATWFNVIDHVMGHARSVSGEPASTYRLLYTGDVDRAIRLAPSFSRVSPAPWWGRTSRGSFSRTWPAARLRLRCAPMRCSSR